MDVKRFKELPVLGILRGSDEASIAPLAECAASTGLRAIEITMNTPGAPGLIKKLVKESNNRFMVGAGTVLDLGSLKLALDSGATFAVLPTLVPEVVEYCVKNRVPVFPGALTPQEIYNAWRAGATMVKVFPAKFFGPAYIKEIKGPFQDIELLACGGVNAGNIKDFFSSGASAVAFGASVFKKEWLAARDFASIANSISELLQKYS